MACRTTLLILLLAAGLLVYDTNATPCSNESECLHFEHCCKGNCTSRQFECHHICNHDTHCQSERRCVLGLCVNCTDELTCSTKKCLNDTHCPGSHSCKKNLCTVIKPKDLTSEMIPFIIFIAALSVSLLIVCYNDYILDQLGHRNCTECLDRTICSCSLILRIWMWRHRRLQARNAGNTSSPVVEVQFDSGIPSLSNGFNEKRETGTSWSFKAILNRLVFWRRRNEDFTVNISTPEENIVEETRESLTPSAVASVLLLNDSMNTNDQRQSITMNTNGNSRTETTIVNEIPSQNQISRQSDCVSGTLPKLSMSSDDLCRSSAQTEGDVNMAESTLGRNAPTLETSSHLVTTV